MPRQNNDFPKDHKFIKRQERFENWRIVNSMEIENWKLRKIKFWQSVSDNIQYVYTMRNNTEKLNKLVLGHILALPYFEFDDLAYLNKNKNYVKIILSRYKKKGSIVRLKKGIYTSRIYIEKLALKNAYSDFLEMVSNIIYQPSYLSLEYVLSEHGMLTESPKNIIAVSLNKTASFANELSYFFYHKIKPALFTGFKVENKSGFSILKASKAKALFDFLYFRKNILINKETVSELRLNLDNFKKADIREFKKYLDIDGSKKMKEIFNYLF